jgi:hypothetical protein
LSTAGLAVDSSSVPPLYFVMPAAKRFPYEEQTMWTTPEQGRGWYEILESIGAANVRARLAQVNTSSHGSIAIGTETSMTVGFVRAWLAWQDKQAAEREQNFRRAQIFRTRWADLAASTAAIAAAIGWFLTAWREW